MMIGGGYRYLPEVAPVATFPAIEPKVNAIISITAAKAANYVNKDIKYDLPVFKYMLTFLLLSDKTF
jgi:hypothetical protein